MMKKSLALWPRLVTLRSWRYSSCSSWTEETTFVRRRPCPRLDDRADIAALLTNEMRKYMDKVATKPPDPWFHRKSEKLVLAILMVHVDGVPQFVPGINAEVSLPAGGSFCAERSAIVAARAQFPGIQRADFAGIAVVQVPLWPDTKVSNPLRPCGACAEWLNKLQEENENFRVVTYTNLGLNTIEEFLPSGGQWSLGGVTSVVESVNWADTVSATGSPNRSFTESLIVPCNLKLMYRIAKHWPPPQSFGFFELRHRIPWMPSWWLKRFVKLEYLEIDASNDKKFRVRAEFAAKLKSERNMRA